MRVPDSLAALTAEGIITEVVRPLRSGKEAQIYLVLAGDEERVAKIYKDAENRSFKHRSDYMEGRRVRNSRDQRAMGKHTKHGRAKDEDAWRSAEVEAIYRLRDAGVRVPEPFHFVDGVLVMELVKDAAGQPAPRLGEVEMTADEARVVFEQLLREVVRMLCAGVVHGDLSDFNVLMDARGPVLIDFPQWVDASRNQNARELLIRDVDNLTSFLARFEPTAARLPYGQEIWSIYERSELVPETVLTGRWQPAETIADTAAILREIEEVELDEQQRRIARGLPPLERPATEGRQSAGDRRRPSDRQVPREGQPPRNQQAQRGRQPLGDRQVPREGQPAGTRQVPREAQPPANHRQVQRAQPTGGREPQRDRDRHPRGNGQPPRERQRSDSRKLPLEGPPADAQQVSASVPQAATGPAQPTLAPRRRRRRRRRGRGNPASGPIASRQPRPPARPGGPASESPG